MADFGEGNERVLKPVNFGVEEFNENKVYPRKPTPGGPDQYGQVGTSDKDKSKLSGEYTEDVRRTHTRADTDTGPRALHHTLGVSRNQASPGDHEHDGTTGRKMGPITYPLIRVNPGVEPPVYRKGDAEPAFHLTGSKDGNVALTNLIAFLSNYFYWQDDTT